ncbi:MAG: alanine racemase [Enterobacteriaceae bacterium]
MKAATAIIDRTALRHNLQQIHHLAPQSKVMAVVKANAYGHGLLEVAKTLQKADCFGVARVSEALALRSGGIVKPILLLEGFISAHDLPILVANNIDTVLHNEEQLHALERAELERPVKVWMKVDSGMHRLGVRPEQAEAYYQRLLACSSIEQPVNLMTHFSRADEPDQPSTAEQIARFEQFVADNPGQISMAASAGILLWPQSHRDWVRPGILLYGVAPLSNPSAAAYGFKPVMTLKSYLIAVREHHRGEQVGYGGVWRSARDTRLGVVAIGYGDGYPRDAASGTPVWINGREVPIVGRVSMDMISVDLGPNAEEQVGDEVILWGSELPVEKISQCTGISSYELITRLTSRVEMEYKGR